MKNLLFVLLTLILFVGCKKDEEMREAECVLSGIHKELTGYTKNGNLTEFTQPFESEVSATSAYNGAVNSDDVVTGLPYMNFDPDLFDYTIAEDCSSYTWNLSTELTREVLNTENNIILIKEPVGWYVVQKE